MSEVAAEYLVIGDICIDHTPLGTQWGGTAMFGAITAHRLGARVRVLTSMPDAAVRSVLPEAIEVRNIPSPLPLTFHYKFTPSGFREQYISNVAQPLHVADLPEAWQRTPLIHFGPLAQEIDHDLLAAFGPALRGASVQGWLRRWGGAGGHVEPLPPDEMLAWVPNVECSFLSEEDIGQQRGIIDLYRRRHKVVVLTDGAHGATIFEGETSFQVPAFPVREVDANGAGDVFAAAFLLRYQETGDGAGRRPRRYGDRRQ